MKSRKNEFISASNPLRAFGSSTSAKSVNVRPAQTDPRRACSARCASPWTRRPSRLIESPARCRHSARAGPRTMDDAPRARGARTLSGPDCGGAPTERPALGLDAAMAKRGALGTGDRDLSASGARKQATVRASGTRGVGRCCDCARRRGRPAAGYKRVMNWVARSQLGASRKAVRIEPQDKYITALHGWAGGRLYMQA